MPGVPGPHHRQNLAGTLTKPCCQTELVITDLLTHGQVSNGCLNTGVAARLRSWGGGRVKDDRDHITTTTTTTIPFFDLVPPLFLYSIKALGRGKGGWRKESP